MRLDLARAMERSGIDLEALPTLPRILLCTDGTVTDILEAHYNEAVDVVVLQQGPVAAETGSFGVEAGPLLGREILLRGRKSSHVFIYANSLIAAERLPPSIRAGLLAGEQTIGHLFWEARIETFKEIRSCWREEAGQLGKHFGIDGTTPLIGRNYGVYIAQQLAMLITEKFPAPSK